MKVAEPAAAHSRKSLLEDLSSGRLDFPPPLPVPAGRVGLCVNKLAPITSVFPCQTLSFAHLQSGTFAFQYPDPAASLSLIHSPATPAAQLTHCAQSSTVFTHICCCCTSAKEGPSHTSHKLQMANVTLALQREV